MDSVVDVNSCRTYQVGGTWSSKYGGIQTRYENPDQILSKISSVGKSEFVPLMQKIYSEPVKKELIHKIKRLKNEAGLLPLVEPLKQL